MKVRVLRNFRDKHTRKIHKAGTILNIKKERYDEILTVGKLVEKVTDDKTAK